MYARRTRPGPLGALAATAVLMLVGCANEAPSGDEPAASPVPTVTALPLTIPEPKGAPLLTIGGKIGAGNQGDALVLDETGVAGLAKIDLTFSDPFQKKPVTLKGVWLADLLAAAEVEDAAVKVHMTALDDYAVDITMDDVRAGGVFLAVARQDGSALPVADGGPTRLAFADGTTSGANSDQWIWSLTTIEVQ